MSDSKIVFKVTIKVLPGIIYYLVNKESQENKRAKLGTFAKHDGEFGWWGRRGLSNLVRCPNILICSYIFEILNPAKYHFEGEGEGESEKVWKMSKFLHFKFF